MDLIAPFLFGAIGKIYDDIVDLHIYIPSAAEIALQAILIILYIASAYNDFSFALITTIFALTTYGVDTPYWRLYSIIGIALCFIAPGHVVWPLFTILTIGGIIVTNLEDVTFPEEVSVKKAITRIIGLLFLTMILPIIHDLDILYLTKLVLIILGALIISIPTQIFMLYNRE